MAVVLRRVGHVECIGAEDKVIPIREPDGPSHTEAQVGESRSAKRVSSRVSKARRPAGDGFGVDVSGITHVLLAGAVLADNLLTADVLSKLCAASGTGTKRACGGRKRKGHTALTAQGAVQLPATQDVPRGAGLHIGLTFSEGKLIVSECLEVMRPVKARHRLVEMPVRL